MASDISFIDYVMDTLRENDITYKKMFGEYGLYQDGIYFGMICNNQLFIKISEQGKKFLKEFVLSAPYPSAKEIFLIENIEDYQKVGELINITCDALRKPKKKG